MWKHLLKRNAEAAALTVPLAAASVFAHGYGPVPFLGGVLLIHGIWSLAVVLAFGLGRLTGRDSSEDT